MDWDYFAMLIIIVTPFAFVWLMLIAVNASIKRENNGD